MIMRHRTGSRRIKVSIPVPKKLGMTYCRNWNNGSKPQIRKNVVPKYGYNPNAVVPMFRAVPTVSMPTVFFDLGNSAKNELILLNI